MKCQISNCFFYFLCCRILKESLQLWSSDFWEVLSIMKSTYVLSERFAELVKSPLLQVTNKEVRLMRGEDGFSETFSLLHGLIAREKCPTDVYWQKHPTMPLLFQYPCDDVYQKTGALLVTSEINQFDRVPSQSAANAYYSKCLSLEIKTSSKRQRLWRYEDEDDDRDSP